MEPFKNYSFSFSAQTKDQNTTNMSKRPRKSNDLKEAEDIPCPISLKKEKIKAENDEESDVGSDFCNDSIFDDSSDNESRQTPPSVEPSLVDRKKESRLITVSHCLSLYKDLKKIPSLKHTRTSMILSNQLLKIPTAYNSPLASQNNVSFGVSSGNPVNTEVSNINLFSLPTRTKQLTRTFGFHFKDLTTPTILRGHEKMEKLKSSCKKTIPKKYLQKYERKKTKKVDKANKKLEKRENQRQRWVQDLISDIPKLDYDNVKKFVDFSEDLKKQHRN